MRAIISRRSEEKARTAGSSLRTTTTVGRTVGHGNRVFFETSLKPLFFALKTANVREKADDTGDVLIT